MLYNNGEQFNLAYFNGEPIGQIFYKGQCIFPANDRIDSGILVSGYIWNSLPSSGTFRPTSIVRADSIPTGVTTYSISASAYFDSTHTQWAEIGGDATKISLIQKFAPNTHYMPGDVVLRTDTIYTRINTCYKEHTSGETYDDSYFHAGCYPEITGMFNPNITYAVGDVIVHPDQYGNDIIYTCIDPTSLSPDDATSKWYSSYVPRVQEYNPNKIYNVGDVVYYTDEYGYAGIYTKKMNTSTRGFESDEWLSEYCPGLLGEYEQNATYNPGDVVYRSYSIYTCKQYIFNSGTFNSSQWTYGYRPGASGPWNSSDTYKFKDTCYNSSYPYLCTADEVPAFNIYSAPIYAWYTNNTVYWYMNPGTDANPLTCRANSVCRFGISTSSSSGSYPNRITDISGLSSIDMHATTDFSLGFYCFRNLQDLDATANWNMSNVETLYECFGNCTRLVDISALANWDTSNVTNLSYCFYNCTYLTDLTPLASWNTSNVTNMSYMFYVCTRLTSLDGLQNWDVSNVTTLANTFRSADNLVDISALTHWDVSNVTNITQLFSNNKINDLTPLASWDVSNVTNFSYTFDNCSSLVSLDGLQNWDITGASTLNYMFNYCTNLTDISALALWDTSNLIDLPYTFYHCIKLEDLTPLASWDISNIGTGTAPYYLNNTFSYCSSLQTLDGLQNWDITNIRSISGTFSDCRALTDISALSNWDTSNLDFIYGIFDYCSALTDLTPLSNWDLSNATRLRSIFSNCRNLTDITPLRTWDVSNATDFSSMFYYCSSLQTLDGLQSWSIGENTRILSGMFDSCLKLSDISALSNWDVSSVTNMSNMFDYCRSLLDYSPISNWDVSNVTVMSQLFYYTPISSLEDIENWDTSSVTLMVGMFSECQNLTPQGLSYISNWDVSSVISMVEMFMGCIGLTSIPELHWQLNTTEDVRLAGMFHSCTNLTDISGLRNLDTSRVRYLTEIFRNCTNLTDISPLSTWNITIRDNMKYAFAYTNISDFSPIYNWKLTNILELTFIQTPIETWDFTRFTRASGISLLGTFYNCTSLTICDLGVCVYEIGNSDYGTSSTHRGAFQSCSQLHTLIIRTTYVIPLVGYDYQDTGVNNNFSGTRLRSSSGRLYVPSQVITDYKSNTYWKSALLNSGCQVLPLEGSPYENPGSI